MVSLYDILIALCIAERCLNQTLSRLLLVIGPRHSRSNKQAPLELVVTLLTGTLQYVLLLVTFLRSNIFQSIPNVGGVYEKMWDVASLMSEIKPNDSQN